jgi:CubicO group peptidase (beta-lactamase class C family)
MKTEISSDETPGFTRRSFSLLLGAVAGGSGAALAQDLGPAPSGDFQNKALLYLRSKVVDMDGPGLCVSVRKQGVELVRCSFGMSDMDQRVAVGPRTVFHLASVTKQFTAFAICLLAVRNKLKLSTTIDAYFPMLPHAEEIMVSDLVHHTSGLQDQLTLLCLSGRSFEDYVSQDHMLQLSFRQRGLNFQPGTDCSYSNSGYTLLAEIVRIVSGMTLRQFLAEQVFVPFGMKNTFINDEHGKVIRNRARSSFKDNDGAWRNVALDYQWWGPTSLNSTASDLTVWGSNFVDPPTDLAGAFATLRMPGRLRDGREVSYCGGLQHGPVAGTQAFFHGGSDAAFRTHLLHIPSEKLSVAVLANTPLAVLAIADDLAAICMEGPTRALMPNVVKDGHRVTGLAGTYVARSGSVLVVREGADGFTMRRPGVGADPAQARNIIFRDDGSFDTGAPNAVKFTASRDKAGSVSQIAEIAGISNIPYIYRRIEEQAVPVVPLQSYEGAFYSDELDCTYNIVADGNELTASSLGAEIIRFRQFAKDRFLSDSWHFTVLVFQRNGKGKVKGFLASSQRTTDVSFGKRPSRA